jgi:serine protease
VVAVLDTGVSAQGSDTPTGLQGGWDFVDDDSDASDLHGHGTHVAGTIAQATNNGVQGAGVAPGAGILPVRVLDADGSGYTSDIIDGIVWAVDNGAQVLNLSLGSNSSSASELLAVEWAVEQGAVVVAASGNNYGATVSFPAGYEAALAVGATDAEDARAAYSNRGTALDLVAPGGDLNADLNGDGYGDGVLQESFSGSEWGAYFFQGTSMAAPHVAGVAALLIAEGATAAEAEEVILNTADDLGAEGWDSSTGVGLLNAGQAVTQWLERDVDEPAEEEDPTEDGSEEDGTPEQETDRWDWEPEQEGAERPDVDAPEVVRQDLRRRDNRVSIMVITNEPSTLQVCTHARRCIETKLSRRHTVRLETDARRLRLAVEDEAGNRRRLDSIVLADH